MQPLVMLDLTDLIFFIARLLRRVSPDSSTCRDVNITTRPQTLQYAVLERSLVGVARLGWRRRRRGDESQRRLCWLQAVVVGGDDYDLRGALPDRHAARESDLRVDVLALVSLRGTPPSRALSQSTEQNNAISTRYCHLV